MLVAGNHLPARWGPDVIFMQQTRMIMLEAAMFQVCKCIISKFIYAKGTSGCAGLLTGTYHSQGCRQAWASHMHRGATLQQIPRWQPCLQLHRHHLAPLHRQQRGAATKHTANGPMAAPL